jgi:hypothetical protein
MHLRRLAFILLASMPLAAPLAAQGSTYRIRLYEPYSIRIAPVVRTTLSDRMVDSLPLVDRQGRTQLVPRRHVMEIDSLAVSVPRGQRARRGAVDGMITGAVVGAVFGALSFEGSGRSRWANMAAYGGAIAVGGGVIGGTSGALRSGDTWIPVWPLRP